MTYTAKLPPTEISPNSESVEPVDSCDHAIGSSAFVPRVGVGGGVDLVVTAQAVARAELSRSGV